MPKRDTGASRSKKGPKGRSGVYGLNLPQSTDTEATYGSPYDQIAEPMRATL